MMQRMRDLCTLFRRDERGQAMVMTAILGLVLFRSVMASYNTGVAISARIRGQTVADAAAFSGAVWQARFLNYCAYTRRAILANYAHIGLLNAHIVNKMAMDNIYDCNDLWITAYQDRSIVKDSLDILKSLRDQMVPVEGDHGDPEDGNAMPNAVDGQRVAEHMNVLISESQEALHASIFPIEGVMERVVKDSNIDDGEIVQAGISHAFDSGLIPSTSFTDKIYLTTAWNANIFKGALGAPKIAGIDVFSMLPKGLVYRDKNDTRIPKSEITPLFESGHTKVGWPQHWGLQMFQGRPFNAFGDPATENPDYLKIIDVHTVPLPWFGGNTSISGNNTKGTYKTGENGFYGFPGMLGFYLWFYLRIDTPWGPIIIFIATPILGNGEKWEHEMQHDYVHVYEVNEDIKNSTDYHLLEPRVYSAIAMVQEHLPYFYPNKNNKSRHLKLLNEDKAGDLICISSAKVYFHPFGANEASRVGAYPDTHYPFFGAKLATIKDGGRKGSSLVGPGRLLIEASRNPISSMDDVGIGYEAMFRGLGWDVNY